MSIKIISLDTSTSCTGVCIWNNEKYIDSYTVETNKKLKGDEKINQMIDLLHDVFINYQPDIIVVEQVAVTRNAVSTRMLQELTGAIRGYCMEHNIVFISLRPTEWRKVAVEKYRQKPNGRKREDQKAWSLDIVNNRLNIDTDSDDRSDAILIGEAYIEICRKEDGCE